MSNGILFICKQSESNIVSSYGYFRKFSGLFNSARFVVEMLNDSYISANLVTVNDNNDIDREVTKYKPKYVIIEAFWVVPEKFEILTKLHPNVKWIIRSHSDIPFMSSEGVSMEWTFKYLQYSNVYVAFNALHAFRVFRDMAANLADRIVYLPNYYPVSSIASNFDKENSEYIDISCFGAIRPLKNQLTQAIAAITFADTINKKLRFHINSTRVEMQGDPVLKNLRNLFKYSRNHELVEHGWEPHDKFLELVDSMDVCMQVSFTESFNIVAADAVAKNKPIVVSSSIKWLPFWTHADPCNVNSIVRTMLLSWKGRKLGLNFINKWKLKRTAKHAMKQWHAVFNN